MPTETGSLWSICGNLGERPSGRTDSAASSGTTVENWVIKFRACGGGGGKVFMFLLENWRKAFFLSDRRRFLRYIDREREREREETDGQTNRQRRGRNLNRSIIHFSWEVVWFGGGPQSAVPRSSASPRCLPLLLPSTDRFLPFSLLSGVALG